VASGGQLVRLRDHLLRPGDRVRPAGSSCDRHQRGLPAVRPIVAGLGHRPRLHLGQPRRHRDLGDGGGRRKYGISTVHFYWIGAVLAMVFLGIAMMPFYYGSKVRSVPEYLLRRFNKQTHLWNALTFAVASLLTAGVNL